jgi:uncharacterized protein with WD repeat
MSYVANVGEDVPVLQWSDTTSFEWCPDGEHILTSTCSPRLRVANG